jgi:hypothetical protein
MHTLSSIINKLEESIGQIEIDKIAIDDIMQELETIADNISLLKSQQLQEEAQDIFTSLGRISQAIQNLSVRRGSLMARTSKEVPWKVLMYMDEAIHKLECGSLGTLKSFLKEFIDPEGIKGLKEKFASFKEDIDDRLQKSQKYLDLLKKIRDEVLPNFSKEKEQLEKICPQYNDVLTIVQSIANILNVRSIININKENLQFKLTDLEKIKDKVADPFLQKFIKNWKVMIGFNVPEDLNSKYLDAIKEQEQLLRIHFKFQQGKLQSVSDQTNKVTDIKSFVKISLRKEFSTIKQQLNEIKSANLDNAHKRLEKFLDVKLKCYHLELQYAIFGTNNEKISQIFETIKACSMEYIDKAIQSIEQLLSEVNPVKEQKGKLKTISEFLFGRSLGEITYLTSKFINSNTKKLSNDNKKPQKQEPSPDEKLVRALGNVIKQLKILAEAKSELTDVIEQIHGILINITSIKQILREEDNLKNLFKRAHLVEEVDELPEVGAIFESIDKYYTTIVKEEKIDEEHGENNEFSPVLLKLLQYQFDVKNISLCLEVLQNLLERGSDEKVLDNPIFRFILLNALTKLGESTKDLSRYMQSKIALPLYIFRSIRNKIFHTLIDYKEGREEFWNFIQGNSEKMNKFLLIGCLKDLKDLDDKMRNLERQFKIDKNWDEYPDYQTLIKQKKQGAEVIRDTFIKILRATDKHVKEVEQPIEFPNLAALEKILAELGKTTVENANVVSTNSDQQEQSSEQKKLIQTEKLLLKAINEIDAIVTFFKKLKITKPLETSKFFLKLENTNPIEIDEESLAAICELGMAYCGGLLKALKDYSIAFQNIAPDILLKLSENIIFMRGEAAHTIAAKNSQIELNELFQINDDILPLLQVIVNNFRIQLLPELEGFDSKLHTLSKQFDNTLGSAFSRIHANQKLVTDLTMYINTDMENLMSLYKAIDYYKNQHKNNCMQLEDILSNVLKLPNTMVEIYRKLLSELENINTLVSDVEKQYQHEFKTLEIENEFKLQTENIKNQITELREQVEKAKQYAEQQMVDEESEYLSTTKSFQNKLKPPAEEILSQIEKNIEQIFHDELIFIRATRETLRLFTNKIEINKKMAGKDKKELKLEKELKLLQNRITELYAIFLDKNLDQAITEKFKNFQPENRRKIINYLANELKEFKEQLSIIIKTYNYDEYIRAAWSLEGKLTDFKGDIEKIKDGKDEKTSIIELAGMYYSEIEKLTSTFSNELKRIEDNHLMIEQNIERLKELHQNLSELANAEVLIASHQEHDGQDKEDADPNFSQTSDEQQGKKNKLAQNTGSQFEEKGNEKNIHYTETGYQSYSQVMNLLDNRSKHSRLTRDDTKKTQLAASTANKSLITEVQLQTDILLNTSKSNENLVFTTEKQNTSNSYSINQLSTLHLSSCNNSSEKNKETTETKKPNSNEDSLKQDYEGEFLYMPY